ncbi:MAG: hypothetical protein ACRDRJ_36335 [Streptosporangiaceae bacterium]
MNPAYSPGAWSGFGGVTATPAAALVGFLFIAMAINLRQILDAPNLPGRAAACTGWSHRCWWRSSAGCSTSGSCSSRSSASHPPPAIASRVAAI